MSHNWDARIEPVEGMPGWYNAIVTFPEFPGETLKVLMNEFIKNNVGLRASKIEREAQDKIHELRQERLNGRPSNT